MLRAVLAQAADAPEIENYTAIRPVPL